MIQTADDMVELGDKIGKMCRGGEIFILRSDLGGGKTTLTRGLARSIGEEDSISSPSFTLQNTYEGDKMTIEHFDFYRLSDPGIMSFELDEALRQPNTIVVVEWPEIVHTIIPKSHISIDIHVEKDDARRLSIQIPEKYSYIAEGLEP